MFGYLDWSPHHTLLESTFFCYDWRHNHNDDNEKHIENVSFFVLIQCAGCECSDFDRDERKGNKIRKMLASQVSKREKNGFDSNHKSVHQCFTMCKKTQTNHALRHKLRSIRCALHQIVYHTTSAEHDDLMDIITGVAILQVEKTDSVLYIFSANALTFNALKQPKTLRV